MMVDGLETPPRVEGSGEGANSDGFGGKNSNAMSAIELIMAGLKPPIQAHALK